ncbi:hypothetical protein BBK82_03615 [Lentzea guizhouensis]|uniref:Uncharacterized protein n=1 Tax=Lentzea guizhouensis TaxID=1586287 RepID=A0A1B2HC57_9PSEU|nr:hypothetical protein [Lentzea guizhouensis]ANZ35304.1 hypothetical protein BBK82_03615 [Lentzea guizhouensis]
MADLDDTSRCPQANRCDACGTSEQLQPATLDTIVGVFCATLCLPCAESGESPRLSLHAAAMRVLAHCEHLGIDLDEAAELRRRENDRG